MMRSVPGILFDPLLIAPYPANPQNRSAKGRTISSPRLVIGQKTIALLGAGQSQLGNSIDGTYSIVNSGKVDNLNIFDGGTYVAADPLTGCSGLTGGNLLTRVADKLITGGYCDRVIVAACAVGGTSINAWVSGGVLHEALLVALRRLAAVGLQPDALLWQLGETDGANGMSQATFQANMNSLISQVQNQGFNPKWFVARSTWNNGVTSAPIRAAQAAVVNNTTVFAGPDTDTLNATYRQADNTHFTAASGADAAATLWVNSLVAGLPL